MNQEANKEALPEESKPVHNPFEDREIFIYHPIEEGGTAKPEIVRFYMPRRREWAELRTELLITCAVTPDALESALSDISNRVNMVKMAYATLDHFAIPEDTDHIGDLSPNDIWAIQNAIQPHGADLTEEHQKNSPSHSGPEKKDLDADNAKESLKPLEGAPAPVSSPGV